MQVRNRAFPIRNTASNGLAGTNATEVVDDTLLNRICNSDRGDTMKRLPLGLVWGIGSLLIFAEGIVSGGAIEASGAASSSRTGTR